MNEQKSWNIPQAVDGLLDDMQSILLSVLIKLGPFAVALMPALFTAYAIYHTFESEAGRGLAVSFAVVVALAVETVGIVATHTAIDLYNGVEEGVIKPVKFRLMTALVPVYVVGVAGVVWYSDDAFTPLVQALGIASPFLTCIVYIAVALARDLASIKQGESQKSNQDFSTVQDERAFERELKLKQMHLEQERELKRLQLEQEREIKRAEIDAKLEIERAKAKLQEQKASIPEPAKIAEPAQSQHACVDCGRIDFSTVQALNAHKRFCNGVAVAINGNSR